MDNIENISTESASRIYFIDRVEIITGLSVKLLKAKVPIDSLRKHAAGVFIQQINTEAAKWGYESRIIGYRPSKTFFVELYNV